MRASIAEMKRKECCIYYRAEWMTRHDYENQVAASGSQRRMKQIAHCSEYVATAYLTVMMQKSSVLILLNRLFGSRYTYGSYADSQRIGEARMGVPGRRLIEYLLSDCCQDDKYFHCVLAQAACRLT